MIIYEITARVEIELIEQYETYMREQHIPDLLKTGYFQDAELSRIVEGNYRVRYVSENRESLEKYFQTDAESLREDFIRHFPAGVSVERNILEVLQTWD